jgi:hypothetical protein
LRHRRRRLWRLSRLEYQADGDLVLKVLPDAFANDTHQCDAELRASLNRPNIAHINCVPNDSVVLIRSARS